MEEIKVGEYVRTKKGDIHKVIGIREELRNGKRVYGHKAYYLDSRKGSLTPAFITKHSPNIIDLIEVGDYVNGIKVIKLGFNRETIFVDGGDYWFDDNEIKTIVTKEQFKNAMYEV